MTTKSIYKSILCISFFLLTVSTNCLSNPVNNLLLTLSGNTEINSIVVKYVEGTGIRFKNNKFTFKVDGSSNLNIMSPEIEDDLNRIESLIAINDLLVSRTFLSFTEEELDFQRITIETKTMESLANLNLYYTFRLDTVSKFSDIETLLVELNQFKVVELAYAETLPVLANTKTIHKFSNKSILATPILEASQGYLDAAPNGIGANYAWNIYNTPGLGVKIVDIEGAWNTMHEDFPSLFYDSGEHKPNDNLPGSWYNHGTSVMGVIGALNNTFGVRGIASYSDFGIQVFDAQGGQTANAILSAASNISVGDIILIELQIIGPEFGSTCFGGLKYVPVEYNQAEFDAIRQVTLSGKIVVEAAGNGDVNLDSGVYNNKFNRNFRDSGAIFVGASKSSSRERMCFSNYGSRVDVHAWGENVATLGKWYNSAGMLFDGGVENKWYRRDFNGTSSASPIVTGAVAILQSIADSIGSPRLDSIAMRSLLSSTGTPQAVGDNGSIGSQPDLEAAITQLVTPDLPPDITILTPSEGAILEVTNSYTLTASASDDNGIVSVQWDIDGPGGIMDSGTGLGVNYAFSTSVFTTPGQYIVSARAEDTIGQIKIDTNVITVISLPEFQSNVSLGQKIDFSFVNDGTSASRSIEISNLGQGDLQVTGCSVNNTNFSVTGCPFTIPGSSATTQDITVQCTPSTVNQTTTLIGTLTINTNDSDEAVVNYPLNCTALSPDALFADSGEPTTFNGTCSLSRWTGNYGFTAATQAITPRYDGVCGFQQSFASVLEDKTPLNEPRLRARFYFYAEPSGTTSGTGITTLLTAFQSNSVFNQVFDIKFDGTSVIINSTGVGVDAVAAVSNTGWHSVEFDWNQNGQISLWVDSDAKNQPASASGTFNTMNRVIGAIYLGEPGQLDSNYSRVIFDGYESHRTTVIGRLVRGDSSADDFVNIIDVTTVINEIMGNSMSIGTPDCNEDGAVNVSDYSCMINIITGN